MKTTLSVISIVGRIFGFILALMLYMLLQGAPPFITYAAPLLFIILMVTNLIEEELLKNKLLKHIKTQTQVALKCSFDVIMYKDIAMELANLLRKNNIEIDFDEIVKKIESKPYYKQMYRRTKQCDKSNN